MMAGEQNLPHEHQYKNCDIWFKIYLSIFKETKLFKNILTYYEIE